jgi:pyruvate dehydrogenase E2 component (dihydrolipoamide acetyltransferase)
MSELLMPKLSDTMEEGTVLGWLVPDGAVVVRGQAIVEIETDKADMTVEAPENGPLRILAGEGSVHPVGAPIAWIGEGAPEAVPPPAAPAGAAAPAVPAVPDELATNIPVGDDGTPQEIGMAAAPVSPAAPIHAAPAAASETPVATTHPDGTRIIASPLARQIAHEVGIDLANVRGTGPGGRIVRADVDAVASAPGTPTPAPAPSGAPTRPPATATQMTFGQRIPATRLQRTIARRMQESVAAAPHFALQRDVDATELIAVRRQLAAARPDIPTPSVTDLIIRALAIAAAERPDALARWETDAFVVPDGVHVGVAVAVERGLLVPVVRGADTKSVTEIAAQVRDLAARCRDGSITPAELEGSTITVSNLGMYGIDRFTAVINPPEAAILAVGAARPQPVVRDGDVVVRDMMTFTLSVDHRSLYGAEGATFLARVAQLVEMPYSLVAG